LAEDDRLRRLANDARGVDDGYRPDGRERGVGRNECRPPFGFLGVRSPDVLTVQAKLLERRVNRNERLAKIAGENAGEVGGATIPCLEQLRSLRTKVHRSDAGKRYESARCHDANDHLEPTT